MSRTFLPHVITDDSALGGKVIERSLRFRSGSSSNLEKINSSAGNRRTMTYSFWFKRVGFTFHTILRGKQGASDRHGFDLLSDGGVRFWGNAYNASPLFHVEPSRLLRDLNAWYHLVLSIDTTQSTASDRAKLYINGDLKYAEEGFITNIYSYNGKSYGPSFRYGIYQNNAPKVFNGKITAWYDGIARAKKCTDKNFSELLSNLGYSCDSLGDKDNQVIKPTFIQYKD